MNWQKAAYIEKFWKAQKDKRKNDKSKRIKTIVQQRETGATPDSEKPGSRCQDKT